LAQSKLTNAPKLRGPRKKLSESLEGTRANRHKKGKEPEIRSPNFESNKLQKMNSRIIVQKTTLGFASVTANNILHILGLLRVVKAMTRKSRYCESRHYER
jgi:hypothetical protein